MPTKTPKPVRLAHWAAEIHVKIAALQLELVAVASEASHKGSPESVVDLLDRACELLSEAATESLVLHPQVTVQS